MKAKKWLTIITLVITALSLVLAFIIGKNSNCITYDISMAIFGGAALGFIMSLTEYYVERRKAMEEFWLQATKVLNELKKIKYLDVDAPINLIVDAIHEDDSNALKKKFHLLSDDEKISVKSTRYFPTCSHNFPKAGEARFQGRSRLFRLLGKFPYLGESRRILMAVSSKTSSKTRFYYAATRRISSAAVQPSIWA